MSTTLLCVILSIRSWFRTRASLQVEILALRHQIAVLSRSQCRRLSLNSADRLLRVWLSRLWSQWRSVLLIVKLETVIGWPRKGFRLYWNWKSRRGTLGRPQVCEEVRELIRKMSLANSLLGAHLGSMVSFSSSASRYRKQRSPNTWFASEKHHPRPGVPP
jgi:putative transposase